MTILKRFYALTRYMPIEVSEPWDVPVLKTRDTATSVVEWQDETITHPTELELRNTAIQAAKELGSLPSLLLFEDFAKAKEHVEQNPEITKDTSNGKIKNTKKQCGIVELVMDWEAVKAHISEEDTSSPYLKLTQNNARNYVIHQVWPHNLSPIPLSVGTNASSKYKKFFNNGLSPQYQAAALFEDYYQPRFFSLHWYHHQNKAKVIGQALIDCQDAQEAYQTLFSARRIIFNKFPTIKRRGSFMSRLDYALDQLSIPAIAAQVVSEAEMAKEAANLIKKTLEEVRADNATVAKLFVKSLRADKAVVVATKAAEEAKKAVKNGNAETAKAHAKTAKNAAEKAVHAAEEVVEIVKKLKDDEASYYNISGSLDLYKLTM